VELSDYLRILRQRGWLIIVMAVLTAGAAFGYSQMQTPLYKSVVSLLVTSRPDFGQTQAAKVLVRDFAAWLNSTRRAEAVIEELQLDMTPEALLGQVNIAAATSESIVQIEVENTNPDLANDIARVWGQQLIQWRNEQNAGLQKADRINAELIDDPRAGLERPKTRINTAAGGVFGALLGLVAVFVLEWIESGVVRRGEDVERYLDIPVIGSIPQQ
jgi:capsular polysaccharide biosynthesis protein